MVAENIAGMFDGLKGVWGSFKSILWKVWVMPFNAIRNLPLPIKIIIVLILVGVAISFIIYWYKNKDLWKYC